MVYDQQEFDVRCEWGEHGVAVLAPISDVVIIVDVLSFSTAVDIAVQRGATVFPFRWKDDRAREFAESMQAELADPARTASKYSLSPKSLVDIPAGTRIVLPSPNGATLTLAARSKRVLAGCIRNARAVALALRPHGRGMGDGRRMLGRPTAASYGQRVAVIAAGERWKDDMTLRPSYEDLVGAGAIIQHLPGSRSPEAASAVAAFLDAQAALAENLRQCISGRELIERGFPEDVELAAQLDVSDCVPTLVDDAFVRMGPTS